MNEILITGSTGFVGSNLTSKFIENGYSIVTPNRKKIYLKNERINSLSYDEIWSNLVNAKHYVHLAGKAHDLKKTSEVSDYFKVNYELTKRLYDRFLDDKKAQTFVFISSVKAVADEVDGELFEDHLAVPVTAYGRSKLKAEEYILNNMPNDRTVVILRPCMIHGPGNKGNLNLLHSFVSKGIPWPLGSYHNSRSFISIDNMCFVINETVEGQIPSGVYNVADDGALSTTELVSIIADISNKKSRIWNIPKSIIQMMAKVGNVLPIPLNEERLQKLTENYLVSNKKIKTALGIKKMPVSAREGMKKTLKDFKSS